MNSNNYSQRGRSSNKALSSLKCHIARPEPQAVPEIAATDLAEAKKHALLKKHGYKVNAIVE